jgi:hypothetical protein
MSLSIRKLVIERILVRERLVELGVVVQGVGAIPDEAPNRGERAREHRMSPVRLHLELVAARDQRSQVAKAVRSLARTSRADGADDLLTDFFKLVRKPVPCSLAWGGFV